MNKVILIGHLGADPVLKDANGTSVSTVSLATKESYKDKDGNWQNITDWHTIELWGKPAEAFVKNISKGDLISLEGALKTKSFEDKEGVKKYSTKVMVSSFQLEAKNKKEFVAATDEEPVQE